MRVKDWSEFQHYSDRNPPWIKLYNTLLDDHKFYRLQDDSKLLLICIWMLASRNNNRIPYDIEWLSRALPLHTIPDLDPLIQGGWLDVTDVDGNVLSIRKQTAIPETYNKETETDSKETETDKELVAQKNKRPGKTLIQHFGTKFKEYVGTEPHMDFGKDGKLLKSLADHYGEDAVIEGINYFFGVYVKFDDFSAKKPGVGVFYSQWNNMIAHAKGKKAKTKGEIRMYENLKAVERWFNEED